jgi:uncharacterized protein
LLDKKIPDHVGGPHFDFQPYDYGPFDKNVYGELEKLARSRLTEVEHHPNLGWNGYRLAPGGLQRGNAALRSMPPEVGNYVKELSHWVRSLRFAELITAVYKEFPEMSLDPFNTSSRGQASRC